MVFETKKLQIETLSEYLREIRKDRGLSVPEVAAQTGIKQQFLEFTEAGEFQKLPPDVYVIGFLTELGRLYGIEPEVLIAQFKKERGMVDPKHRAGRISEFSWQQLAKNIIITPKLVSVAAAALFLLVTVGYVIFQLISINSPPRLSVDEPKSGSVVNDSTVTASGRTEAGVSLTINDQAVFVDSEGKFEAKLGISPGQNELILKARDKFDHEVVKKVSVISQQQPTVLGATTVEPANPPITLNLRTTGKVTMSYSIDNEPQVIEQVEAGSIKDLSAASKLVISVSDGGAVAVKLNGKQLGTLGKKGQSVQNVEFNQQSVAALNNQ